MAESTEKKAEPSESEDESFKSAKFGESEDEITIPKPEPEVLINK